MVVKCDDYEMALLLAVEVEKRISPVRCAQVEMTSFSYGSFHVLWAARWSGIDSWIMASRLGGGLAFLPIAKCFDGWGTRLFGRVEGNKQRQRQKQQQIPSLRCGMTNKGTGNGNSNGNSRSSACGEG